MQTPEFLTPRDVAAKLRFTERAVQAGSLRRELPWILVGNRLRVRATDLDAYMRRHRAPACHAA